MSNKLRILVSNLGLPYHGIGSWTAEFNYFLKKNNFFDFILSPTQNANDQFVFCEKKSWFPGANYFRKQALSWWVAKSYLQQLQKLGNGNIPLQILVIDDQALLEAICDIKPQLPKGTEVVFYYHGHALTLHPSISRHIDKVFFLTKAGYFESLKNNIEFTPEVCIIGNGVSSELFYPLTLPAKEELRQFMGYSNDDIIICWMANSRPVKGIHLFGKMIPKLLALDPRIKIITIGHEVSQEWKNERVAQVGRKEQHEIAKLLQISDYYFFTSLWKEGFGLSLVEAIKCGNFIFSSENGGIKDVISSYPNVQLINTPNIIESWIGAFEEHLKTEKSNRRDQVSTTELSEFYSLVEWERRLISGLN